MPRYYFHVKDGKEFRDLQGTDLVDLAAARREALRFTGDLLNEQQNGFWTGEDWAMDVTDHAGIPIFKLTFAATDHSATSQSSNAE